MARQVKGTRECPNCGADMPLDCIACPECGSDEETGWSQETEYDDLDLPTGYGEERDEPSKDSLAKERLWKVVAIGLLILIFLGLLSRLW